MRPAALGVAGDLLLIVLIGRTDSRSTSTRGGVRNRSALTRVGRRAALWPLHDAPHTGLPTRCGAPSGSAQRTVPPHSGSIRTTLLDPVHCSPVRRGAEPRSCMASLCVRWCCRASTRTHVSVSTCVHVSGRVVVVRSVGEQREITCRPPRRLLRALRARARRAHALRLSTLLARLAYVWPPWARALRPPSSRRELMRERCWSAALTLVSGTVRVP